MANAHTVSLGSGVTVAVRDGHPVLARAARYVIDAVRLRTGLSWNLVRSDNATILIELDDQPCPDEQFTIDSRKVDGEPKIKIVAHSRSVVMAAAGRFVRGLATDPGWVEATTRSITCRPALPTRAQVLANHKQTNTYDHWSLEQWDECLTELAALGNNLVLVYPAQPSRWHGSLPYKTSPWFDSAERAAEWHRQYEIQQQLPRLCHELGMRYGVYQSPNDIWPQLVELHPDWATNGGPFVCPHVPAARREIMDLRRRLLGDLPAVDVLFIPSKDDGGCRGCERCHPWVRTYIDLISDQAALARELHPDCNLWLSQQGLSGAETSMLVDWLKSERPDYVEAVAYGPFSESMLFDTGPDSRPWMGDPRWAGPEQLIARLDGTVPVVLYPDIVHPWRAQYAIAEMDDITRFVWGREDAPVPRFRDTVDQFTHTVQGGIAGVAPYSEGDTDDTNKFAWSILAWEPDRTAESIAKEYATWYFGSELQHVGATMLLDVESALHSPIPNRATDHARMARARYGSAKPISSWRWTMLLYAVALLEHIDAVTQRDRELVATLRFRVASWWDDPDLLPGLQREIRYLAYRLDESTAAIRELKRLRDQIRTEHSLRVRSTTRAQTSYRGFDNLASTLQAIAARLVEEPASGWLEIREQIVTEMSAVEEGRNGPQGIPVMTELPEFPWETGPTRWHSP